MYYESQFNIIPKNIDLKEISFVQKSSIFLETFPSDDQKAPLKSTSVNSKEFLLRQNK